MFPSKHKGFNPLKKSVRLTDRQLANIAKKLNESDQLPDLIAHMALLKEVQFQNTFNLQYRGGRQTIHTANGLCNAIEQSIKDGCIQLDFQDIVMEKIRNLSKIYIKNILKGK